VAPIAARQALSKVFEDIRKKLMEQKLLRPHSVYIRPDIANHKQLCSIVSKHGGVLAKAPEGATHMIEVHTPHSCALLPHAYFRARC
jgi:hypothetical protein